MLVRCIYVTFKERVMPWMYLRQACDECVWTVMYNTVYNLS